MKVYELMEALSKCPAGAREFVATVKPIEELLNDNSSDDDNVADISFLVKNVGGSGGDIVLGF